MGAANPNRTFRDFWIHVLQAVLTAGVIAIGALIYQSNEAIQGHLRDSRIRTALLQQQHHSRAPVVDCRECKEPMRPAHNDAGIGVFRTRQAEAATNANGGR